MWVASTISSAEGSEHGDKASSRTHDMGIIHQLFSRNAFECLDMGSQVPSLNHRRKDSDKAHVDGMIEPCEL